MTKDAQSTGISPEITDEEIHDSNMDIIDKIRAQRPHAKHVTATLNEDTETWHVEVDGIRYTMQVGSDDDAFVFTSETGDVIDFDFE